MQSLPFFLLSALLVAATHAHFDAALVLQRINACILTMAANNLSLNMIFDTSFFNDFRDLVGFYQAPLPQEIISFYFSGRKAGATQGEIYWAESMIKSTELDRINFGTVVILGMEPSHCLPHAGTILRHLFTNTVWASDLALRDLVRILVQLIFHSQKKFDQGVADAYFKNFVDQPGLQIARITEMILDHAPQTTRLAMATARRNTMPPDVWSWTFRKTIAKALSHKRSTSLLSLDSFILYDVDIELVLFASVPFRQVIDFLSFPYLFTYFGKSYVSKEVYEVSLKRLRENYACGVISVEQILKHLPDDSVVEFARVLVNKNNSARNHYLLNAKSNRKEAGQQYLRWQQLIGRICVSLMERTGNSFIESFLKTWDPFWPLSDLIRFIASWIGPDHDVIDAHTAINQLLSISTSLPLQANAFLLVMKTLPQMVQWFTVYQLDFGEPMTVTVVSHALFNADYIPDLTLAVDAIPVAFDNDKVKLLVTLLQKFDASPTLMPLMKLIFNRLTVAGRRRAYKADSRIVQLFITDPAAVNNLRPVLTPENYEKTIFILQSDCVCGKQMVSNQADTLEAVQDEIDRRHIVRIPCGLHFIEMRCLLCWLPFSKTCPYCRTPIFTEPEQVSDCGQISMDI